MTLYQIVSYLKQIALSSPYIRTAEEGSVYTIMNGNPHTKYGVFVVSQTLHRQDEIFDYYGLNLFVIDRLVDDLESNRLQIQSLAKEVLANTILTFVTKFYGITHNELQFHPFTEKFVDLTAGQYVQVTFQVPRSLICPDEYNLDFTPDYMLKPLVVEITENGIFEYEPTDFDGYNKVTVTVNVDIPDNYEEGFESGVTYQKTLLTPTAFTENGVFSTENGYGEVTVNVDIPEILNQTKTIQVEENGEYIISYDEGYTGLEEVTFQVDVSGYTQEDLDDAYESGVTSGVTYQKSLLEDLTVTHNGEYENENGYGKVTVLVPQTGESINNQTKSVEYTQNGDYSVSYDAGFTGLEGINISINVPQSAYTSGYTQEDLDAAFQSGITYQKSLLSAVTLTENGTYIYPNGISAITVNVNGDTPEPSGETEEDMYLTFECLTAGTIGWKAEVSSSTRTIEYSKNGGTWTSVTSNTDINGKTVCSVVAGDKVRFRGHNFTNENASNLHNYFTAKNGLKFKVYGNIMSLVYGDDFKNKYELVSAATFCSLFYNNRGVIYAAKLVLPATTLSPRCYMKMFKDCTNLVSAPTLPATTLELNCYEEMFFQCFSLTSAKCYARNVNSENHTKNWMMMVQTDDGRFFKKTGVTWPTGSSGIPSKWTVIGV